MDSLDFWINRVAIQIEWTRFVQVLDGILDSRRARWRARWENCVIHIVLDLKWVRSKESHNLP